MVPVCDKRYHIYNRFRHFWAEIKKLWKYPFNKSLVDIKQNNIKEHYVKNAKEADKMIHTKTNT